MNNNEMKQKILTIVRGAMLEAEELPFIETTDNIADALISAGIGDVKKLQFDNEVLRMRNFFLENSEKSTEKDRQAWISRWEEAEHRAEIAEIENAELRARLDKAVELPFIYEYKTYPDIDEMYCKVTYYVVYKSNDKIYTEQYIDRDRANARLAELKGEKE